MKKDQHLGRKIKAVYFDLYVILFREGCNTPEVLYLSKGTDLTIGGGYSKIRISNSLEKIKCELGNAYDNTCHCKYMNPKMDEEEVHDDVISL